MVTFATIRVSRYPCPVCGYALDRPARSFNICPSCGTEFGYHDVGRSYDELRILWLQGGAKWWSRNRPAPPDWSGLAQLLSARYITLNPETTPVSQVRVRLPGMREELVPAP